MKKETTRRQKWLPYIRSIADILALKDWRVEISEDDPWDRSAIASVTTTEGRKYATFRFAASHFDDTRADQRHTVVHELIHAHLAPYVLAVDKKTNDDSVLHLLMEYGVDALADAVAPLLPLPPAKL